MGIIYTIGYEQTEIGSFIGTLKEVGIELLADVRAVALSRKKGFSKTALCHHLEADGIQYEHFVRLGDPKEGRVAARIGRFGEFRRIYNRHLKSVESQAALEALITSAKGSRTCLMCFERDPATCHRSIIAARLVAEGMTVFDLFGDTPGRYVGDSELLPSPGAGQGATAA